MSNNLSMKSFKSRVRRSAIRLHALACDYMKLKYGAENFPAPKIVFYHPSDKEVTSVMKEAIAVANSGQWTIYINILWANAPWLILNELLPHEMAHIAMFSVENYTHNMAWKKCAMYLGATGARAYPAPRSSPDKFLGVYTYTKGSESIGVIGRPFKLNDHRVKGYYFSHFIRAAYSVEHAKSRLDAKNIFYLNLDNA